MLWRIVLAPTNRNYIRRTCAWIPARFSQAEHVCGYLGLSAGVFNRNYREAYFFDRSLTDPFFEPEEYDVCQKRRLYLGWCQRQSDPIERIQLRIEKVCNCNYHGQQHENTDRGRNCAFREKHSCGRPMDDMLEAVRGLGQLMQGVAEAIDRWSLELHWMPSTHLG